MRPERPRYKEKPWEYVVYAAVLLFMALSYQLFTGGWVPGFVLDWFGIRH